MSGRSDFRRCESVQHLRCRGGPKRHARAYAFLVHNFQTALGVFARPIDRDACRLIALRAIQSRIGGTQGLGLPLGRPVIKTHITEAGRSGKGHSVLPRGKPKRPSGRCLGRAKKAVRRELQALTASFECAQMAWSVAKNSSPGTSAPFRHSARITRSFIEMIPTSRCC
jgi:hypothetical protein